MNFVVTLMQKMTKASPKPTKRSDSVLTNDE